MTVLLDASALVKLLTNEPGADDVEDVLARRPGVITSVNLAEAIYVTARDEATSTLALRSFAEPRMAGLTTVAAVTEEVAWRAAEMRRRHYHGRRSALSLADCIALAAAESGDTIVTADHALAGAARAEGIEVVGLPDARGRRP